MENMLDDLFVYDIDSSPRSNFIQIFVCEKIFLSESGLGILVNIHSAWGPNSTHFWIRLTD